MPNVKQLIRRFSGAEAKAQRQAIIALEEAYLAGKYTLTPDQLMTRLEESGSTQLADLLVRLTRYTGLSGLQEDAESMRKYYVQDCRYLWKTDVVSQWAVWLWTNYGFGENIEIVPDDDSAKPVWEAFWDYEENAPILGADGLHRLSDNVLVDGEFLFVFYIDTMGTKPPTLRTVPTDEITEIITDPDDDATPLYYKRDWTNADNDADTMYYADWLAVRDKKKLGKADLPDDAKIADKQNKTTMVCAIHVAHNRKIHSGTGKLRGWPMYSAGASWAREHTKFRENRASVSAAIAMYVNRLKVDAGSRQVDVIRQNLQSALTGGTVETNPASAAGSTWVENKAATLDRLSQQTGAQDAKVDGESLMQMAALGAGAYSHYFGSGDAYRLAVATAMEGPTKRQWSRYQNFWGAQWRKMVKVVLWAAEEYGSKKFKTHKAQVSTDRLVELGLEEVSKSMSALLRDGLQPYIEAGLISGETGQKIIIAVWQSALQALGISDVMDIIPEDEPMPEEPEIPEAPTPALPPGSEPVPPSELQLASFMADRMKGWDARMEMIEATLREDHEYEEVNIVCPFEGCGGQIAHRYKDHPTNLLVCAKCGKTFNSDLE